MAFESERAMWKCLLCNEEHKWFKMLYSDNPASHTPKELENYNGLVQLWEDQGQQEQSGGNRGDSASNSGPGVI